MNEPELLRVEPDKITADRVRQAIFFPSNPEKMPLLVGLIKEMGASRATATGDNATQERPKTRILVFVNTRREAERVEAYLEANGIDASAISGDVPQKNASACYCVFKKASWLCSSAPMSPRADCIFRTCSAYKLRPAPGSGRLRAPNRPHSTYWRLRGRNQFRLRDLRDLTAGDRGIHRPQDSGCNI